VAWDAASALAQRGHRITLYAGPGSSAPAGVRLAIHADEIARADQIDLPHSDHAAWLDFSHYHTLSLNWPDAPIVNYLSDSECPYLPPNAAVCTESDQGRYPRAALIPLGIDLRRIPLFLGARERYLAFVAKIIPHKGIFEALDLHHRGPLPVRFAGERMLPVDLPTYVGYLCGNAVYQFMGRAAGVLQLAQIGVGGGRIQLEAAATGTPTVCLAAPDPAQRGPTEHVAHGLSGYVCASLDDLLRALDGLPHLAPRPIREWVEAAHSLDLMTDHLEALLTRAADGERW
jgi:hypothetical protein